MKARLWDEGEFRPAVALGINDIVGSGIYGGEYLVASKQFGAIDATLGLGWGRLGSTDLLKNPLSSIFKSFRTRPVITQAGGTDFSSFFHGPSIGLFGGIVWKSPVDGLSFTAEYSSDRYTLEAADGNFKPRSQINVGASYRVTDGIALGLGWLYGTTISGRISFDLNPTEPQYSTKIEPPALSVEPRPPALQRQALNRMLDANKSRQSGDVAASSSSLLVDALWRDVGIPKDVLIDGGNLYVDLTGARAPNSCQKIAQLVQPAQIRTVSLRRGSADKSPVHCDVARKNYRDDKIHPVQTDTMINPIALQIIDAATGGQVEPSIADAVIRKDAAAQHIIVLAIELTRVKQ